MKLYDIQKAKLFIDKNKESIASAMLGMDEDWFWTAETIFSDGKYTLSLEGDDVKIGGIDGSYWATPTLQIEYKDGKTEKYNCYIDDGGTERMPLAPFMFGCISESIARERAAEKRKEMPSA